MCTGHSMICSCGKSRAGFHFRDDVMTPEVVDRLYCPRCSSTIVPDRERMIRDNGWIISYDMEIAGFLGKKLPVHHITPEFLFDEGYCTWSGLYPSDLEDSVRERQEILKIAKEDKSRYLDEFRKWSSGRMDRLAREGWRKANDLKEIAA